MELNETQKKRLELEQQVWEFQRKLWDAKHGCKHTNIAKGRLIWSPAKQKIYQTYEDDPFRKGKNDDCVSVYCQDCDKDFGWFCPVNSKGYCEYNYEKNGECCLFCGQPEERK